MRASGFGRQKIAWRFGRIMKPPEAKLSRRAGGRRPYLLGITRLKFIEAWRLPRLAEAKEQLSPCALEHGCVAAHSLLQAARQADKGCEACDGCCCPSAVDVLATQSQ